MIYLFSNTLKNPSTNYTQIDQDWCFQIRKTNNDYLVSVIVFWIFSFQFSILLANLHQFTRCRHCLSPSKWQRKSVPEDLWVSGVSRLFRGGLSLKIQFAWGSTIELLARCPTSFSWASHKRHWGTMEPLSNHCGHRFLWEVHVLNILQLLLIRGMLAPHFPSLGAEENVISTPGNINEHRPKWILKSGIVLVLCDYHLCLFYTWFSHGTVSTCGPKVTIRRST